MIEAGNIGMLLDGLRSGVVLLDREARCQTVNASAVSILSRDREALLGSGFRSLLAEPSQLHARLASDDTSCWRMDLIDGRIIRGHIIPMDPLVAVEIWDDAAGRETEALTRVADAMAYAGSLEATMKALADAVREAVACEAAMVVLTEGGAEARVRFAGTSGLPREYVERISQWRLGLPSVMSEVIARKALVVKSNVREKLLGDPHMAPLHDHIRNAAWDSVVIIPLLYHERCLGMLNCYFAPRQAPSPAELRFLRAIASLAAVAVENADLISEVQDKAALDERQRLARELHDSVSQALFGVALGARTAREMATTDPAGIIEPLDYVLALAEGALAEMRALIFQLRPETLESEGLVTALHKHLVAMGVRHKLEVRDELSEEPAVPSSTKQELYRVVQEAVHNTVKHARAHTLTVRMTNEDGRVTVEIEDDGIGFDSSGEFPGHLGLTSMRERMQKLGGRVEIVSAPGAGTRLQAWVPQRAS